MAVSQTQDAWNLFKNNILPGIENANKDFLENYLGKNVPFCFELDNLESSFDKPTLIITGRQDSTVGYRGIWSILENYTRATFAVLDGGGHNLHTERVELFGS